MLRQVRQPRLEIKKDAKGMVIVPGAVMVEVTSARELLATFEKVSQPLLHVGGCTSLQTTIQPWHKCYYAMQ